MSLTSKGDEAQQVGLINSGQGYAVFIDYARYTEHPSTNALGEVSPFCESPSWGDFS